MTVEYTYDAYVEAVLSGGQVVCGKVRQAVERHRRDQERQGTDGFPFYFDPDEAERVIRFCSLFRHNKGPLAGKPFRLEPWQQFLVASLYGWRRRSDGSRRFRRAYIQEARKNGKTLLGAILELYALIEEPGAEVYSIATKRDQARISFKEAKMALEASQFPRGDGTDRFSVLQNAVTFNNSAFQAMSAEDRTSDGFNPSFVLVDEYHAHRTDDLVNVYLSGMGARQQPLLLIITTAGSDRFGPCKQEYDRCAQILDGVFQDEETFALVFELDEGDDWKDESVWIKANPNLDVSVSSDYLRMRVREATQKPSALNDVLTKNFDLWTDSDTVWLPVPEWISMQDDYTDADLEGLPCVGSFDLSRSGDLTSWTICFLPTGDEGRYRFLHRFWIPEDLLEQKLFSDNPQLRAWIDEGWMVATPGRRIDLNDVEEQIRFDASRFDIRAIYYDRYSAQQLVASLSDLPFPIVEYPQTKEKRHGSTQLFEDLFCRKRLAHNGSPVMTWNMSCVALEVDRWGLSYPVKPFATRTGKRIDGVITTLMALDIAVNGEIDREAEGSVYETRGLLTI